MAPKSRDPRGKNKEKLFTASTSETASPSIPSSTPPAPTPPEQTSTSACSPPSSPPPPLQETIPEPFEVRIPKVIPTKLRGVENYCVWKEQIRSIIISHDLEQFFVRYLIPAEYASESDRMNGIFSEKYQEWLIKDQMLYSWLLSSISQNFLPIITRCIHSWEIWHTISGHMESVMKARAQALRWELNNTKKTSYLSLYFRTIQGIVDSLAEAGDPVSEKEHIEAILNGLPEQYKECANVIRGRHNPPPLQNVVSLLNFQEMQIEQFNILVPVECLIPAVPATPPTAADPERPPGPPDDDSAPSSSSNSPSTSGGRSSRRRGHGRGGRRSRR